MLGKTQPNVYLCFVLSSFHMDRLRGSQGNLVRKCPSKTGRRLGGSLNCMAWEQIVTLTWTCWGAECKHSWEMTSLKHVSVNTDTGSATSISAQVTLTQRWRYVLHQSFNILPFQLFLRLRLFIFSKFCQSNSFNIWKSSPHPKPPFADCNNSVYK